MRARRRSLEPAVRAECAHRAARLLAAARIFHRARRIACYYAVDGELDPAPLVHRAWAMGKTVYLPVLAVGGADRLWFAPYRPHTPLLPNRFGISEPRVSSRELVPGSILDLVVTPLVAFDAQGCRLGMGGGFYDRTFAFLKSRRHWQRPRLVGYAYEFQKTEGLHTHPWDVPLYAVVTEMDIYHFNSS